MSEGSSQLRTENVHGLSSWARAMGAEARWVGAGGGVAGGRKAESKWTAFSRVRVLLSLGPRSSFSSHFNHDVGGASPAHLTFTVTRFRSPVSPPVKSLSEATQTRVFA